MKRRRVYLLCAVALFAIEVLIATKLSHWGFVRSSLGDVLVTMLLYCLALAFADFERVRLAAAIFVFSCAVEAAQYFQLAQALGLAPGSVARIVIGDSFSWADICCYLAGCVAALGLDFWLARPQH
ncbi:MAG TPA: DUF2809 domain-containing protein [Polyangiaceae bacterium]|nr:DUF2809 domain-containing protein [Polyangiaceae bacterium]